MSFSSLVSKRKDPPATVAARGLRRCGVRTWSADVTADDRDGLSVRDGRDRDGHRLAAPLVDGLQLGDAALALAVLPRADEGDLVRVAVVDDLLAGPQLRVLPHGRLTALVQLGVDGPADGLLVHALDVDLQHLGQRELVGGRRDRILGLVDEQAQVGLRDVVGDLDPELLREVELPLGRRAVGVSHEAPSFLSEVQCWTK